MALKLMPGSTRAMLVRRRGVQQISVGDLKAILEDDDLRDTVQLLDVREPWEAKESSLPHFTLLPLSRRSQWI